MFEGRLVQGGLLKKVLEATRELITEANFEVGPSGISLQAMDSSHVSLVSLQLRADGFDHFRCDRAFQMGMNLNNMGKMLKWVPDMRMMKERCANSDDAITIKSDDAGSDTVAFLFEAPGGGRVAEFELRLMDIASESLGIPDTEYAATVRMPAAEFQRIVRDLATIGDTVEISVTKDGVKFATAGDIGSATVIVRQSAASDRGDDATAIDMSEPVALTFALRYLNSFAKATALSPSVVIKLSRELPVVVEYKIEAVGYVRYYLAPKIDEEEEGDA